jgi:hypothetical protein
MVDFEKNTKNENITLNAIEFENELITENEQIAKKFNYYFIDSVKEINESIELLKIRLILNFSVTKNDQKSRG